MKNAIITGSSRGLGRAIAEALGSEAYRIWISGRSEKDLDVVKSELENSGFTVEVDRVDFSNADHVRAYASRILDGCETIDVLVNNVGIYQPDSLTDDASTLDLQMAINFEGPYTLTQSLIGRLIGQGRGNVFNICSVVNRKPRTEAASYTISKFAFWGYHKVLHQELLPHGVKVTAFFPSSIATSSWDGIDAPMEEFVQPEDIASMVINILHMKPGTVPSEIDLVSSNPDF